MRRARSLTGRTLTALLLLAAVGCSTVDTEIDWDPDADFARLETYRWLERKPSDPGRSDDPFLAERARTAIDAALAEHGYRAVGEHGPADFAVTWHAAVRRELRVETIHSTCGYGFWPRHPWYGGGFGYDRTYRRSYDVGTLVVDVVDPKTNRLMWRGTASALVGGDRTPKQREARVREMVGELFERFPPEGG